MNWKNDMSERFGKFKFFDRTEPAFAAVRKLHKKRFDLNEYEIKSGTSEEMVLVRLNHLRRVLQHSSVVEPNRFVSLGVRVVRLLLLNLAPNRILSCYVIYRCLLPGPHRFFRSTSSCSELIAKKHAGSYPNIICVLVHLHDVMPAGHIDRMLAH